MKIKNPLIGIVALSLVALAACSPATPSNPDTGDSTTSGDNYDPSKGYFKINQDDYKVTFNQVRTSYVYSTEANQKGDVGALVVPIEFTDYPAEKLPAGAEGTREDIQKTLFGDPATDDEIGWESLSSFYEKSSYGQCHITGDVMPWYNTRMTAAYFEQNYTVNMLVDDIYTKYVYEGGVDIDMNKYDKNNDGYVDLFLMVYSCPTGNKNPGGDAHTFWAYTTQFPDTKGQGLGAETALISRYWWASIEFMYNDNHMGAPFDSDGKFNSALAAKIAKNEAKLDAHTFIHETGHGLGLADYYSYDYNGDSPMGGVDMMDNNIGDHNAYSKALYGWISPYVVENDCEITLKPFGENGDSIIVPIRELDWRTNTYSLLDEYLVIEYDTPIGLAVADGQDHYDDIMKGPLYYNIPGVRILHTDSRIGHFYSGTDEKGKPAKVLAGYLKQPFVMGEDHWADFAHDNTATRTYDGNRLLEVVEPAEQIVSKLGYQDHLLGICTNESLWQVGDVMENYKCNTVKNEVSQEKYDLGFRIEIKSMDANGCTIAFTAK